MEDTSNAIRKKPREAVSTIGRRSSGVQRRAACRIPCWIRRRVLSWRDGGRHSGLSRRVSCRHFRGEPRGRHRRLGGRPQSLRQEAHAEHDKQGESIRSVASGRVRQATTNLQWRLDAPVPLSDPSSAHATARGMAPWSGSVRAARSGASMDTCMSRTAAAIGRLSARDAEPI